MSGRNVFKRFFHRLTQIIRVEALTYVWVLNITTFELFFCVMKLLFGLFVLFLKLIYIWKAHFICFGQLAFVSSFQEMRLTDTLIDLISKFKRALHIDFDSTFLIFLNFFFWIFFIAVAILIELLEITWAYRFLLIRVCFLLLFITFLTIYFR